MEPNNTNTAYGLTAMRSQAPETSPRLIVWLFIGFTLCICLDSFLRRCDVNKVIPVNYPTPEEKLAHLVKLTADELSKTKDKKKQHVLVNQLQHYRELWERSKEDE